MITDDIHNFAKARTKARAYFCYLFSNNLPDKLPDLTKSMVVPKLLSLKADLVNCEGAYLLDYKGEQVTPTFLPEGQENTDGIGSIRSDRAYYYRAVKEKRCTMTDPYPSLITGELIKKFGHTKIIYTGVLILVLCIVVNFIHQSFYNYVFGLILLGIGWNFTFVTGTSLLVVSYEKYEKEEKFRTQGFNDFLIFSSQALGSLSAGYFLYLTNWQTINLFCLPLLLLIIYTSYRVNK